MLRFPAKFWCLICLFAKLVIKFQARTLSQRKYPGRSKDERTFPFVDGDKSKGEVRQSQSTNFSSFGSQRKEKKGFLYDFNEQQVYIISFVLYEIQNLQHTSTSLHVALLSNYIHVQAFYSIIQIKFCYRQKMRPVVWAFSFTFHASVVFLEVCITNSYWLNLYRKMLQKYVDLTKWYTEFPKWLVHSAEWIFTYACISCTFFFKIFPSWSFASSVCLCSYSWFYFLHKIFLDIT